MVDQSWLVSQETKFVRRFPYRQSYRLSIIRFTFLLGVGKYIRSLFLFSAWDVHSSASTLNFIRLFVSLSLSPSLSSLTTLSCSFSLYLSFSLSFSLVFYKQLFYFSPLSYLSINVRRFPLSYSLSFDSLTSRLSTRNPKTGSVCLYLHTRGLFARVRFFWYALPFNASRRIRTHDSRESHAHFRYVAGEYIRDAMARYRTGLSLTGFTWNLQFHFVRINYSVAQLEYVERWMMAVYDYVVDCNCHDTEELRFDIVSEVLRN